jgi:hypothetical protein
MLGLLYDKPVKTCCLILFTAVFFMPINSQSQKVHDGWKNSRLMAKNNPKNFKPRHRADSFTSADETNSLTSNPKSLKQKTKKAEVQSGTDTFLNIFKEEQFAERLNARTAPTSDETEITKLKKDLLASERANTTLEELLKQATYQMGALFFLAGCMLLCCLLLLKTSQQRRKSLATRWTSAKKQLYLLQMEIETAKATFQQQKTELEMRLGSLQMNPHFIANSLNSINYYILQNNRFKASEYLSRFSALLRLLLQQNQSKLISLESELESLQLYLDLEAVRLRNRFDYKICMDEGMDTSAIRIPPLLIQPFVENAIWHGLMHKKGKGHLCVDISRENELLLCKITDDGIGRKRAAELKSSHAFALPSMGIRIIESRIALLMAQKQTESFITINDLVLPDGAPGGTEVVLKIPVRYD